MFGTEVVKRGAVIRRSKNLRGMRDYARVSPVVSVDTYRDDRGCGFLMVKYEDGAFCGANFRSHAIMIDFVRNRRTWRGARIAHHGGDMGYLTRPGVIAGPCKVQR